MEDDISNQIDADYTASLVDDIIDGYDTVEDKRSLDERLNAISYKDMTKDYVPTIFTLKFMNFLKLIQQSSKKPLENSSSIAHYYIMDSLTKPTGSVINLCGRGLGKTSLIKFLFFYIGVYGEIDGFGYVRAILYVTDTEKNGVKNFREGMEGIYRNSEFLQSVIPDADFKEERIVLKRQDGHLVQIKLVGVSGGVRGVNLDNERIHLAIFDDLLSEYNVKSEKILQSITNVVTGDVRYALHPTHKKVLWAGTPFNETDPIYEAVNSGAYTVNVFPVCSKFPCKKEEFDGAWADRFTYESVMGEYIHAKNTGALNMFYRELMLQVTNSENLLINISNDFGMFDSRALLARKANYNFFITTDFAYVANSSNDLSCILVWAINSKGSLYIVDGMARKQSISDNMEELFNFVEIYNPVSVGIETNGTQVALISWINKEKLERGLFFNLASSSSSGQGIRRVGDKISYLQSMLPIIKQGKIHLPADLIEKKVYWITELINELSHATQDGFTTRYDDMADCFTMIQFINMLLPAEKAQESRDDVTNNPKDLVYVNISGMINQAQRSNRPRLLSYLGGR